MARSEELSDSISGYFAGVIKRFRPQTIGSALEQLDPDSIERGKYFLAKSLLGLLSRDDTARTINAILSSQIERLLVSPIGRLADHMPAGALEKASSALTEKIVA